MVEFRRKFYDLLLRWKAEKHQECLLVKGARQIGKTFIIEKFGHEQYESFIEFNFVLDSEACSIFDGSLKAEDLYRKISAYDATRRLLPGRTLSCRNDRARRASAFLFQDGGRVSGSRISSGARWRRCACGGEGIQRRDCFAERVA